MSKSNGKKKTLVTTTNTNKKDTKPTTTMTTEIGRDEIAMRAYSIFLSGKGGSELDHWLQAERELTSTQSRMHT